ncbi:MAG: Smr/MutS family protein, partial [Alphaproteobacteria bacterium]|nr:Smr/MutS family protein [Alphaproteobacteria bacterium]
AVLDLHQLTEEQAWTAILDLAKSGTRNATIITGASGILKIKFQQWASDSVLSPYIISFTPINNGSFSVKFKKQNQTI